MANISCRNSKPETALKCIVTIMTGEVMHVKTTLSSEFG